MSSIKIFEAGIKDFYEVSKQVTELLLELEPNSSAEIQDMNLPQITQSLLNLSKIYAFLAKDAHRTVGVITLHECAAIYAGGLFGEISELYVNPKYRSCNVGKYLVNASIQKAKLLGWKRIEVGAPPIKKWQRTLNFYENNGFSGKGVRLRRLIPPSS